MKFAYDHTCPFEIYLMNLTLYNNGIIQGEWVEMPAKEEELNAVLKRIGITENCEWFISDYDCYVPGLCRGFSEYESLAVLNTLAERILSLSDYDLMIFSAIAKCGEYATQAEDYLDVLEHLSAYTLYTNVLNYFDLGYYFLIESGISNIEPYLNYIDFEKYGRDLSCHMDGVFTDSGFLCVFP